MKWDAIRLASQPESRYEHNVQLIFFLLLENGPFYEVLSGGIALMVNG